MGKRAITADAFQKPSGVTPLSADEIFAKHKFDPLVELVESAKRTKGLLQKARDRLDDIEVESLIGGDGSEIVGALRLIRDLEASYDSQCRELAQYAYAKRKAVEVTGPNGGPMNMSMQVSFVQAKPA